MFRKLLIVLGFSGFGCVLGCGLLRMANTAEPTAPAEAGRPATEDAIERRLAALGREFAEKKRGSCITLGDRAFDDIREDARFRSLIRKYVDTAESWMLPEDEPGERLIVNGVIRDTNGKPVEGALVYAYQTDRTGVYSRVSGGNTASRGDSLNPRVFAFLRTRSDGRYGLRTIRPGGYPDGGPPAHIHFEIEASGFRELVTELMFSDDTRMTPDTRRRMERSGVAMCEPSRDDQDQWRCNADLVLEPA